MGRLVVKAPLAVEPLEELLGFPVCIVAVLDPIGRILGGGSWAAVSCPPPVGGVTGSPVDSGDCVCPPAVVAGWSRRFVDCCAGLPGVTGVVASVPCAVMAGPSPLTSVGTDLESVPVVVLWPDIRFRHEESPPDGSTVGLGTCGSARFIRVVGAPATLVAKSTMRASIALRICPAAAEGPEMG